MFNERDRALREERARLLAVNTATQQARERDLAEHQEAVAAAVAAGEPTPPAPQPRPPVSIQPVLDAQARVRKARTNWLAKHADELEAEFAAAERALVEAAASALERVEHAASEMNQLVETVRSLRAARDGAGDAPHGTRPGPVDVAALYDAARSGRSLLAWRGQRDDRVAVVRELHGTG